MTSCSLKGEKRSCSRIELNSFDPKKPKNTFEFGGTSRNVGIISRTTPNKSPRDPNNYRVIKLSNGLTAALISRDDPFDSVFNSPTNSRTSNISSNAWPNLQMSPPECHYIQPELEPLAFNFNCKSDGSSTLNGDASSIFTRTGPAPSDSTSIAVVVNVGGLDDPFDYQGLAHLTEHMVHYGTKKYPEEDAVNAILINFGTYNATTRQHTTSYYNEVPNAILNRNLALFADMLAQPLFAQGVLDREVKAVDNEFYMRLPVWRKYLLQSHCGIESQRHPFNRFICGSLETLGGGTEVQKAMQDNHRKYYGASAMTVSINVRFKYF